MTTKLTPADLAIGLLELRLYDPCKPDEEPTAVAGPFLPSEKHAMARIIECNTLIAEYVRADDPDLEPGDTGCSGCLGVFPWSGPRNLSWFEVLETLERSIIRGLRSGNVSPSHMAEMLRDLSQRIARGMLTADSGPPEDKMPILAE